MENELVTISIDRFHQLEALEARFPTLIEDAIKEYKTQALKRLHEKDKTNPKAVAERARRYAEKNRDAINERRRQKRNTTYNCNEIPPNTTYPNIPKNKTTPHTSHTTKTELTSVISICTAKKISFE